MNTILSTLPSSPTRPTYVKAWMMRANRPHRSSACIITTWFSKVYPFNRHYN